MGQNIFLQEYFKIMPAKKYIKYFSDTTPIWIDLWKFNGISEKNIENITKLDCNFTPILIAIY